MKPFVSTALLPFAAMHNSKATVPAKSPRSLPVRTPTLPSQYAPGLSTPQPDFDIHQLPELQRPGTDAISLSTADATCGDDGQYKTLHTVERQPKSRIRRASQQSLLNYFATDVRVPHSKYHLYSDHNLAAVGGASRDHSFSDGISESHSEAHTWDKRITIDSDSSQWTSSPPLEGKIIVLPRPSIASIGDDTVGGADEPTEWTKLQRSEGKTLNVDRPYTSSLGVPRCWGNGSSPGVSIISDAGDQEQLRQKRALNLTASVSDEEEDLEHSLALLPTQEGQFQLQERILAARQSTRDGGGQTGKFITKQDLYRVVNTESVTRELILKLSGIASSEKITQYARAVCSETVTGETRKGKDKITSFRKIFALLVLLDAAESIELFLEEKVSDQDLPLIRQGTYEVVRGRNQDARALRCFRRSKLSPVDLENFMTYQWWMLAPFFSQDEDSPVRHYRLQSEHILPFVQARHTKGQVLEKTGGYGRVFLADIPPEHRNFPNQALCERGFAIKQQLHEQYRDIFKREISILVRFSGERSHKHIVSLLATYEQFKKFHLIFHRAEGDLLECWKTLKPRPAFTYGNVLWVAEQCAGIADGLANLHKLLTIPKRQETASTKAAKKAALESIDKPAAHRRRHVKILAPDSERLRTDSVNSNHSNGVEERPVSPIRFDDESMCPGAACLNSSIKDRGDTRAHAKQFGRHGDISPNNILWYDDTPSDRTMLKGTLKITDFGQAEINSEWSRTRTRNVATTLTYRPPESDSHPAKVGQSYDMWGLACVYLEMITWYLGGAELLLDFALKRFTRDALQHHQRTDTFFEQVKDPHTQKKELKVKREVLNFIDGLHSHANCSEYFHDFLDMIQHNMLVVDSFSRKPCPWVLQKLNEMYERCKKEEKYAFEGRPWRLHRTSISKSRELPLMTFGTERRLSSADAPLLAHALPVQAISHRRRPSRIPRPAARQ